MDDKKQRNREAALRWYHKNKNARGRRAKAREVSRLWYHANLDRVRAYRKANAEQRRKTSREWHARNPARKLFMMAKARAKKAGLAFRIKLADIMPLPDVCPALGIPLRKGEHSNDPHAFSIDRIDNTKGYVKGNVAVVSRRANVLKRDATVQELRSLLRWLETRA